MAANVKFLAKVMAGNKRKTLSIKEKLKVIAESKTISKPELCSKYGCSSSTLNKILRNAGEIANKSSTRKLSAKRMRQGKEAQVEQALMIWFNQLRSSGAVISSNLMLEKAKQLAVKLKKDFTPTQGWLWRLQKRNGIQLRNIHGEERSTDKENAEIFLSTTLPHIIANYDQVNIFNADESALFFKALPQKTLTHKGQTVKGFKTSKDRLTLLFICNATGEFKEVIVIGKSKSPRCFKNKVLPLKYYSNKKAWMTQEIWGKVLNKLDTQMREQNRKIVLLVDNAACHKISDTLTNINLQFLPPNTTAITQPLDQGIIHCFKAYYRQSIIRKQVAAIERGQTVAEFEKSLNIFQVIHMIKHSFWMVKPESIQNCFKKAKFITTPTDQQFEDTSAEVEKIVKSLAGANTQSSFETYIVCDDDIVCYGNWTDEEIVSSIVDTEADPLQIDNDGSEDEEETEEVLKTASLAEVLHCIHSLRAHFLPKNKYIAELESMEGDILHNEMSFQTKITNWFFKRNF
ncbi:tigger transposable element-derived protein 6-like [Bactrocera dorsalis]|uniref:Tigger transposable element-derived protein 6-like n=2 Tax=Bactrocera dorsalis TaxID=27457 RepID=A0ABM3J145_BACDO|nr:tigger transposable element-derived protein 6-like [Bactrocera dorsalis]XP_049307290.1 tigger transposable element-derived protein 6-like [Bactrocera dorsalis]XP_049307749.1 tigger transposable element-derived protein 6-like [Bactrocera dorsalis]